MSKVPMRRLDEVGTISRGKSKHRPRNDPKLYGGQYPFVQTADVKNAGLYLYDYEQTYNEDGLAQSKLWEPGTLCITIAANIADTSILGIRACFPDSVMGFIPDVSKCDVRYMKYSFDMLQQQMKQISQGATQDNLSWQKLATIRFPIPDIDVQKRIADAIAAYDNLIENNRRQIALLEEAAQRLYKEWFVDLRFPGHENTEIVDRIPDSWQIVQIRDVCKKIQSGGTPSRKKASFWDPGTVKWFKTGELQDCWLIEPEELISDDGLAGSAAKLFPPLTIVMAIYASPTLGRLGILNCEAAFNQAMLGFIVNEDVTTRDWLYWKLFELRTEFNLIARGAGQQNISGEIVKSYEVLLPPRVLAQKFSDVVGPMAERRLKLQEQNLTVSEARDRLLPKLMSGEVEVGNFADDVCTIPNSAVSTAKSR